MSLVVDTRGTRSSPAWAALAFAVAMLTLAVLGPDREVVGRALPAWTVAFGALAWLWLRHPSWLGRPGVLLGGALLLRILFLLPVQDLSDDLFRYVWDGWIRWQAGVRPYALVPSDPALEALQGDPLFRAMNSPEYHSVYPPLSQWVFLLGGWVHQEAGWPASGRAIRAALVTLELGGIAALFRAWTRSQSTPGAAALALYAWNPLAVLMVAGSGHSEGGLVLGMGILLWGIAASRPGMAWTGLALAVLAKGIPLLLAPLVGRALLRSSGLRATLLGMLPAAAAAAVLSLPFVTPGALVQELAGVRESTRLYVELFEFNAGIHALAVEGGWRFLSMDLRPWLGQALQGVAVAGALWIGARHSVASLADVARGAVLVVSLYLVTATTVHPWYLLWVLPLLPFTPTARWPWMWGAWAALPTYLVYTGTPPAPLALLFWGGMAGVALTLVANRNRERVLAPLRRRAAPRKARWMAPWVQGPRVADVGGGEGDVGGWVLRLQGSAPGATLLLVDPDPAVRAGEGAAAPGWTVQARAERLPMADRSVDTVLLSFVLHHTTAPDQALSEALRVARSRVVILESTWRWGLERRLLARVDRWVNARRGGGGMGEADAPLHHRQGEAWIRAAEALGARVLLADRPPGALHRVLRLVLERPPQAPEELGAKPHE